MEKRIQRISIIAGFLFVFWLSPLIAVSKEVIDIPTTQVTDYRSYDLNFRFYSGGGVINRMSFGVFNRVDLGFSWDWEQVIGAEDIDINEPTLHLKLRFYDGGIFLPALALGYNGQGFFFDELTEEYLQREKGVYLVGSYEPFLAGLEFYFGGNIYDFREDKVFGFTGLSWNWGDEFMLLLEYDNLHITSENRLNAGFRLLLGSQIAVDLVGRDLGAAGRDAERVVKINYTGNF